MKMKYEERKTRIYMRGVKIGSKREGGAQQGMSMFEQTKKAAAEAAQEQAEAEVKKEVAAEFTL
jgi:hypothetical protein